MTDIVSLQSGAHDDTFALEGCSLAGWLATPRELELILIEDCKVDELNGLLRERDVERAEPRRQLEEAAQEGPRSVRNHDVPILATSPPWPEFVARKPTSVPARCHADLLRNPMLIGVQDGARPTALHRAGAMTSCDIEL